VSKESNKKHYERRKLREQKLLPKLPKMFQEGKIKKEEFRRVLVGKNRLEFDFQVTVAEKVKEELQNTNSKTSPAINTFHRFNQRRGSQTKRVGRVPSNSTTIQATNIA
jgi:hypothetical protein